MLNKTLLQIFLLMTIIVISILFFAAIFSTITIRFLLHYAQILGADISSSLYQYYMHQSWLFHVKNNSSILVNKVNAECTRVTLGIIYPLMMLNARLFLAISIAGLLFITDPLITFIGIFVFAAIYTLIFKIVGYLLIINLIFFSPNPEPKRLLAVINLDNETFCNED